jgi:hypothetical protein
MTSMKRPCDPEMLVLLTKMCFPSIDMPVVTLKMGSSLNPDDIKEGADVYFECLIQSNPKPYKMSWFHNVSHEHDGESF